MVYSYLMASIGSILAAFRAGKYPNPTPMMVQTMKLTVMLHPGTLVGRWNIIVARADIISPRMIPMMPPVSDIITDSMRN